MDRVFRIVAPILVVGAMLYYWGHKYKWHVTTPHLGSRGSSLLSGNDKAMADKLAPFIRCINSTDSKLAEATRVYHKMVIALKADPNANEFHSTFDFVMAGGFRQFGRDNEYALNCASGLEKASATSPKVADLDTVGPDYAATLRKLVPLMNQADLYYDQKDYKDDHMARGSELDSQLSPLLDHLRQLSHGMRAGVERENNIVKKHELDAIEARYGKNMRWYTLNFMIQSRAAYDTMEGMAGSGKLDAANLDQSIQPVQAAFDGAQAYAAAHPQENDDERQPTWGGIDGSASSYLTSLKDLRRELQNNAAASSINDQIKDVRRDFNSLVDTYNVYLNVQYD